MLGVPGAGKTALLADLEERARTAGLRVLRATGRESETRLAFAGLHQLLLPVTAAVERLPARLRQSLDRVLGLAVDGETSPGDDSLLPGAALLAVLADLSRQAPVLVAVDDAHWLDRDSLDVLAFAARRLETEPVVMLFTARDAVLPAGFERHAQLRVPSLSAAEAEQLLDALPQPPRDEARLNVLAQAAGNPLALVELSRGVAVRPDAAQSWATPIPVAERVAASVTCCLTELPEQTRKALLTAAVADDPDLPCLAPDALAPAVRLGLVVEDADRTQFTHPLVRSAVYHTAPFADRAAAHRRVAAILTGEPDRRAWHLAAATLHTDEDVARLLEDTAAAAARRGGPAAAAAALQRAAELSPEPQERGRRLVAAADLAADAGQADVVQDLAARAAADVSDPELLAEVRTAVAWALMWTGRHEPAMAALLSPLAEGDNAQVRWTMLGAAAAVVYASGVPSELAAVRSALALETDRNIPSAEDDVRNAAVRLWTQAAVWPFKDTAKIAESAFGSGLPRDASWAYLTWLAPAMWMAEQTDLSIELHEEMMRRLVQFRIGLRGGPITSLTWSYVEAGRWDDALAIAVEGTDVGLASKMPRVVINSDLVMAVVYAMRGDGDLARQHAGYAVDGDPGQNRGHEARVRHALGLVAMGEGDYPAAYGQLRGLFGADGRPLHYHLSYLLIADLAAAAARAGAGPECRRLLPAWLEHLDGTPTPRVAQVIARARALLAEPDEAEQYFAEGLADPAGDTWPYERAVLRLEYGEWLRRQRRINEAKPLLGEALVVFRRLRARPWLERAETELRACGVDVVPPQGALAELSPQQRQVVYLASHGLTNREIADRLFLSSRTVSSHLYQAYPKLGITGRHQLRSVIEGGGSPA
jgi:DNA-binding CsgD family transcriptional regulator